MALQDLSGELRQERQGSQELTQQFAKAKASWEVERNELKSLVAQVRLGNGEKKTKKNNTNNNNRRFFLCSPE